MLLSFALSICCFIGASTATTNGKRAPSSEAAARFIVEFKEPESAPSFSTALVNLGVVATINHEYSTIYNGVSISVPNAQNITQIAALRNVAGVYPVTTSKPNAQSFKVLPSKSPSLNAKRVARNWKRAPPPDGWNIHRMTGVDKLHDRGIKGKGVKIGFLDGGIDYRHPALGGGFGPGFPVAGGYDFVGDDGTPDGDPLDTCTTGTAHAGIIFADDKFTGMVGVAPEATVYAYKLANCFQGVSDDAVLAALEMAYKDGVDVIYLTMSDSVAPGWNSNPIAVATSNLVAKGVFVTMPAGNVGQAGAFLAADSTTGKGVAAVGAVVATDIHASVAYASVEGDSEKYKIAYTEAYGLGAVDALGAPLVAEQTLIEVATSCDGTIPPGVPDDLRNYTVLLKRQDCPFDYQLAALSDRYPGSVFIYNSSPEQSLVYIAWTQTGTMFNVLSVSYEDGQYLSTALKNNKTVTISYAFNPGVSVPNKQNPGSVTDWSSWGPDNTGGLWPQLLAPGDGIFTTYHVNHDSYLNAAGSEISSAYVAGVAVLYYSQHGGRDGIGKDGAAALLQRMVNTASPVKWDDGTGPDLNTATKRDMSSNLAPVSQQGGGLINAEKLLDYSSITVSPSYLNLGDLGDFKGSWDIELYNPGQDSVSFKLSHKVSTTFQAIDEHYPYSMHPNPGAVAIDQTASVTFPQDTIEVPAGQTAKFKVEITPPAGTVAKLLAVYSGFLEVSGSSGEALTIPYQGYASPIHTAIPVWSPSLPDLPTMRNAYGDIALPGHPFHNYTLGGFDYPTFTGWNTFATEELRIDIVTPSWNLEKDWKYPVEPGKNNYIQSILSGSGIALPITYLTRSFASTWVFEWFGNLADGTSLKTGTYKAVISVLRPSTTDRTKIDSWQIVESTEFGMVMEGAGSGGGKR